MEDRKSEWNSLARLLQKKDVKLAPLIEKIGEPDIVFQKNHFRALVEAILSQQLAPRAADVIINRVAALNPPFPNPRVVLRWKTAKLRGAGVSSAKAGYIRALSEKWFDNTWRRGWHQLSDEALISRLCEVKGIGEWTAHMFLIFSLGRPDVLPQGDYGIRRGFQLLFQLKELPMPREMSGFVPHWGGSLFCGFMVFMAGDG